MAEKIPLRNAIAKLNVPTIIAFGNPLLDTFLHFKNDDFLKKHDLPTDGEMEVPSEKIAELVADVSDSKLSRVINSSLTAGGSAQNSMRILQWLCDETFKKQYSIYCGGRGDDPAGVILENLVKSEGVDTRYAVYPNLPTGRCLAFVNESSRCLVANIGAAAAYTVDDLKKMNLKLDTIKIIYIEGFFVTHSFAVAKELVKQAEENDIIIAFNLNGMYIFKEHHAAVCEMVGHANIVFGNAREMIALAQSLDINYEDVTDILFLLNSLKRVTVNVSSTTNKDWVRRGGTFVMSQGGSAPAVAVWGSGQSVQVQPIIPQDPVVDTTGAGDALVAGFLAGVLAGWEPHQCLEYGCRVASLMVTRLGVTLPENVPPDLLQ